MKTKLFSLLSLSILSLVILTSCISATVNYINVTGNSSTVNQGASVTVNFKLEENGYGNLTNMSFNVPLALTSGSNTLTSATSVIGMITSLNQSATSGAMSLTFTVPSTQAIGTYTGNLILTGIYTNTVTYNLPISITVNATTPTPANTPEEINDCKKTGNLGDNLNVNIRNIDVTTGYGNNEEWFPLDEIEIEIDVDNRGSDDIKNIELNWGVYDKSNDNWIVDGKENEFNLKDGKDKRLTINFKLDDPQDFEDQNNYIFYVWAKAEDTEFDSADTCETDSKGTEVIIENDFVVLDNVNFLDTISCGSELEITADVWNIGESDQDEVSVLIENKELGIQKTVSVGDINAFDSEKLTASIKLPEGVSEKLYGFKLSVLDEDEDVYQNDFEDDQSVETITVSVKGSCSFEPDAVVSATLESGGSAGEDLVVKATLTNTGDKATAYKLNAAGFAEWASSVDLDADQFTINAGESKNVLFTFSTKDDASGDYTFDIEVLAENQLVVKQPVSVTLEGAKASSLTGFANIINKDNWYLWGIGILNVVLIIIIIAVAMRVARK